MVHKVNELLAAMMMHAGCRMHGYEYTRACAEGVGGACRVLGAAGALQSSFVSGLMTVNRPSNWCDAS